MKILVLGVTGMLGSTVFHEFNQSREFEVFGTLRNQADKQYFPNSVHANLLTNIDALDFDSLCRAFEYSRPDVVINCIGLIKQLAAAKDPLITLPINAMLPHRLTKLCALSQARLIHISTDCVFSGKKGLYEESDLSDAEDLYGKSKFMGEITNVSHAITIRTSIIGHELNSNFALLEWFLSQRDEVKGYVNAIFSGLPTVELARVIREYIIPRTDLSGLYHVASSPINKFELLSLISETYSKKINIIPDETIRINRSLIATRFNEATGYICPSWPQLIGRMHKAKIAGS